MHGNGPYNRERLRTRVQAYGEGAWVREAASAYAKKRERRKMEMAEGVAQVA